MTETESWTTSPNRIIRRKGRNWISETVERWHDGPGSPGGRTYLILYVSTGRVRIDVGGAWDSTVRKIDLRPDEIRPTAEWAAHLKTTGQKPTESRWCVIDGTEIPQERIDREIPGEPEQFCSTECAIEVRDEW